MNQNGDTPVGSLRAILLKLATQSPGLVGVIIVVGLFLYFQYQVLAPLTGALVELKGQMGAGNALLEKNLDATNRLAERVDRLPAGERRGA